LQAEPYCPNFLLISSDDKGMIPEALEKALSSKWSPDVCQSTDTNVPKVLYVCPSSGNPTGTSLPLERKQAIYKIAQHYNLLIVEDDPYYFLQFAKVNSNSKK
jgi:kynurenine/2-aminoadipate aminotransferase